MVSELASSYHQINIKSITRRCAALVRSFVVVVVGRTLVDVVVVVGLD